MEKYRLKEGARPYFDEGLADVEENIMFWDELGVSMNALEEVKPRVMVIERYVKIPGEIRETEQPVKLTSKVPADGIEFYFTVKFPGAERKDFAECSAIAERLLDGMEGIISLTGKVNVEKR